MTYWVDREEGKEGRGAVNVSVKNLAGEEQRHHLVLPLRVSFKVEKIGEKDKPT